MMSGNLAFSFAFAFIMITLPAKTLNERKFNKYWNQSLVFLEGSPIISMTMQRRGECVALCVMRSDCCCTQWVPSNNTCSLLLSDRVALSANPLAVSSIDSTSLNIIFIICSYYNKCFSMFETLNYNFYSIFN